MTDPFTKPMNLDELAWLTEQYVLGDLDEASCELLEARFAEDQAAREALANAVALLSAATMANISQPATDETIQVAAPNWRTYQSWFVGIAVILLVGAFWAAQGDWFQPTSNGSLAKAWSETREAAASEEQEIELAAAMDAAPFLSEDVETPDWLMTAMTLSLEQGKESKSSESSPTLGEGA